MNQDFILIVFGALEISFLNAVKSLKGELSLISLYQCSQATPLKVSVNDLETCLYDFQ